MSTTTRDIGSKGEIAMPDVFVPAHDLVVIRLVVEDPKKKSGIVVQDSAKEKPVEGVIVSVGPGRMLDNGQLREISYKAGDRVMFGKFSGTDLLIEGEKLLLMREEEIIGTLVEAKKAKR
jgi:chaperonin GroES